MTPSLAEFPTQHRIHEVECVIPDMTGIAQHCNGQQSDNGPFVGDTYPDMVCIPDASTVRIVPWAAEPVAVVIHDCQEWDGSP
jgi:glutamine synthetase